MNKDEIQKMDPSVSRPGQPWFIFQYLPGFVLRPFQVIGGIFFKFFTGRYNAQITNNGEGNVKLQIETNPKGDQPESGKENKTAKDSLNFKNTFACKDEDCTFTTTDNLPEKLNITGNFESSGNTTNTVKGDHKSSKFSFTRNVNSTSS